MTVAYTSSKIVYAGNGSNKDFPIPFEILDAGHLKAYLRDETDPASIIVTPLTEGPDYVLTGVDPDNGVVATGIQSIATYSAPQKIVLMRVVPETQSTDYSAYSSFPSEVNETTVDRVVMQIQQIREELDRALRFPITSPTAGAQLPEPEDGKILAWSSGGMVNADLIAGPQGIQGNQGIPGIQGIQGIQGPQGNQGDQGIQGPVGPAPAWGTIPGTLSDQADLQTALDAKATAAALTTHTGATTAHGVTGAVVGTTDSQSLSNKTLAAPKVSDFVDLTQQASVGTNPALGSKRFFIKSDGKAYLRAYDGVEALVGGSGGGGGGGALQWIEDIDAPLSLVENANRVYVYSFGLTQKLWALVKVPQAYTAGQAITMRLPVYSALTSGDGLMRTMAYLVRPGTDAISALSTFRLSTNSAFTCSGATIDVARMVVLDLSDNTGKIGGVAVSPGDLIKISLYRGADTALGEIKALVYGAEVSFQ